MIKFNNKDLEKLWKPKTDSSGEENGQVTIIGGSYLFHGAPIFSIQAASRIVDMVFFASPEPTLGEVATQIKAQSHSFIWVPWDEVEAYIAKSDAILIGPGMMRYHHERTKHQIPSPKDVFDEAGTLTRSVTKYLLQKYPNKKWVIDGGSLQVMDTNWIPRGAILTPNRKEYEILFQDSAVVEKNAKKYQCVIVTKGPVSYVTDGEITYEIEGGNAGLTKGGTGDTLAGVIVGLLAKNPPLLAAAAGSWLIKRTAERLYEEVGYNFNADDVAGNIFKTWKIEVGS